MCRQYILWESDNTLWQETEDGRNLEKEEHLGPQETVHTRKKTTIYKRSTKDVFNIQT